MIQDSIYNEEVRRREAAERERDGLREVVASWQHIANEREALVEQHEQTIARLQESLLEVDLVWVPQIAALTAERDDVERLANALRWIEEQVDGVSEAEDDLLVLWPAALAGIKACASAALWALAVPEGDEK